MDPLHTAGRLLVLGFDGPDPRPALQLIDEFHPGGVILFHSNCRDAEQLRSLVGVLQDRARQVCGSGLLVAIDQEGGRVTRLPEEVCPGGLSNRRLGLLCSEEDGCRQTEVQARITGERLRSLGININFAPVVDVVDVDGNTVIGDRSYGADPGLVKGLGTAYIRTLQAMGVAATAKHYPGHGHTTVDSHHALPYIDLDEAEFRRVHLAPFAAAVKAGVAVVMTAHIIYPVLDSHPATMSRRLITDELRGRLGFEGAVITDDLNMLAIADNFNAGKAAVAAVNAGADLLLVCNSIERQRETQRAVAAAIETGEIAPTTLAAALCRIAELKRRFSAGWSC